MYRNGAVGALLDLYEQAISDLKIVIEDIPDNILPLVIDSETTDENCKSIQKILEQFDNSLKIKTGWGQIYDIEQMTEHAIVHIHRHKRQLIKLRTACGLAILRSDEIHISNSVRC